MLDLVLVLGFDLAVAGVAWATVAADYAGLALGAAVAARLAQRQRGRWRARLVLDPAAMRRFLGINRDIFLRTLFVITAFALFTTLSAREGDTVLAANAVLLNFVVFFNFAFDGFAFAVEALTGRALGAGRHDDLNRAIRACFLWCLALALLSVAVYGLAGAPIIRVLTDIEAVRAVAYGYLPWLIALPLVAVWGIFLDGVFTGTTRTADMRKHDATGLRRLCALRLVPARADRQSRAVAGDDSALRGPGRGSRRHLCGDPAARRLLAHRPAP